MQVNEIMSKGLATCTRDTSLTDVARLMKENDCGEIPVTDSNGGRRLVGVITDRDIVLRTLADGKDPFQMAAGDCMSQPVVSVNPDASVEECCQKMQQHRIRRMPVVDQNGNCIGMVAQADLARHTEPQQTGHFVKKVSQNAGMATAGAR